MAMGVVTDMEAEQRSAGRHRPPRSPPLPLNTGTTATWQHSRGYPRSSQNGSVQRTQTVFPLSSCHLHDTIETEALTTMSSSPLKRFGLEGQCVSVVQDELGPGGNHTSGRSTDEGERGRSPSRRVDESTQPDNQWVIASG